MPSSHAAGVMGLSTAVGLIRGYDSIEFAIALGYAFIVMYDVAGVRRAAGKQAACLNRIIMDIYKQDLAEAGGKLKRAFRSYSSSSCCWSSIRHSLCLWSTLLFIKNGFLTHSFSKY